MELVSFDDIAADGRLNPDNAPRTKLDALNINDYAMVVVDEAHNLRNPSTQRADALRRLLAGSPPKKTRVADRHNRSTTACGTSTTCSAISCATMLSSPMPASPRYGTVSERPWRSTPMI